MPRFEIPSSNAFVIPARPFVIASEAKQSGSIAEIASVALLLRNDKCFGFRLPAGKAGIFFHRFLGFRLFFFMVKIVEDLLWLTIA